MAISAFCTEDQGKNRLMISVKWKKKISKEMIKRTSAPIKAWKCSFELFKGIMTDGRTNQPTDREGRIEVTLEITSTFCLAIIWDQPAHLFQTKSNRNDKLYR